MRAPRELTGRREAGTELLLTLMMDRYPSMTFSCPLLNLTTSHRRRVRADSLLKVLGGLQA